jgi:sugar phosphate isomerase/epimerase
VIAELDLGVEAPALRDYRVLEEWRDRLVAVHLPFSYDGERLNIAALDDAYRAFSRNVLHASVASALTLKPRLLILHTAPRVWKGAVVGSYERLIDSLQRLADEAAKTAHGVRLCLENNRAYWNGYPPETPPEELDRTGFNQYFGESAEEWRQIVRDVARDHVALCLDTSHATTTTMVTSDLAERERWLFDFLAEPERIAHVHWNGNFLHNHRGRYDTHQPLHQDTLPRSFHQRIKALPTTKTLERLLDEETLRAEWEFIQGL